MAFEKSPINNSCAVSCFPAIKLRSDGCKKMTCCRSICGNLCSNPCKCVPSCFNCGCRKAGKIVACGKPACSNFCINPFNSVASCYGCKAVAMQGNCKHNGVCGNQVHGCFKKTSCGPTCQRSPCNYMTSCHDIKTDDIKGDCRCKRPCGNTCFPVSHLETSSKWKGASCKPACDHCPYQ